ncbi:MAG: Hpt domain-containing protein [Bacteroidia bacterium]|nr:Hpt domain-containing protein [Bacteroidia bacterium]
MSNITYHYLDESTLTALVEMMDGDGEMLAELISTLVDTTPGLMASLEEGLAERDSTKVRESAHALKSSNAQLGAIEFANLFNKLEHMGRINDLSFANDVFAQIQEEYQRVTAALESWKDKVLNG